MAETDNDFVKRMEYIKSEGWDCMTDDEADRLFALARRGSEMQWRPIEDAPKETGKYLLGWNGHHSGVIQYWPPTYEDDPEWVDESTEFIVPPITHFMPLPLPPKGAEE